MGEVKRISEFGTSLEALATKDLIELYEGTVDELQRCAEMVPEQHSNVLDLDLRETALLDLETQILNQAANVQLNTKSDIVLLMDIWAKAASIESGKHASPSDRIVMNIFRHLSDAQLS